jgi:hypothetical protein
MGVQQVYIPRLVPLFLKGISMFIVVECGNEELVEYIEMQWSSPRRSKVIADLCKR